MKFQRKRLSRIPAGLLAVLLVLSAGLVVSAFAQAETGQILVKVVDPTGAIIPGASVTIKSIGTGFSQTRTSSDEGLAVFTSLQPGLYDVVATSRGFADLTKRAEVTVGSKSEMVMSMSTQAVAESVTVVAGEGGVQVNTQSQELSEVVSGKQITELPTLTRNPYDLVGLSGNVNPDQGVSMVRGTGFAINGQR